jgi:type IV pilus assembly protein PilA
MKISKNNVSKRSGFTMVELVVVVVVIALLAAIAAPAYLTSITRAQTTKTTAVIAAIEKAKDAYILARVPSGPAVPASDPFNAGTEDAKFATLAPYLSQSLGTETLTMASLLKGTGKTSVAFGTVQQSTQISTGGTTNATQRVVAKLL